LPKESEIQLFPKPNNGNFTVEKIEPKGGMSMEIYNQVGQIIYQTELILL